MLIVIKNIIYTNNLYLEEYIYHVGDNDTYLALPFGTYACILERFQYFGLKRMLRDFSNDPDRLLWICRIGNEGLRSLEGICCHLEEVALPFSGRKERIHVPSYRQGIHAYMRRRHAT